jgi:hypothetical protein
LVFVDLISELERVVDALGAAGVEYALCGGLAVALHGHVRATREIDLLIPADAKDTAIAALRTKDFTLLAGPIRSRPAPQRNERSFGRRR